MQSSRSSGSPSPPPGSPSAPPRHPGSGCVGQSGNPSTSTETRCWGPSFSTRRTSQPGRRERIGGALLGAVFLSGGLVLPSRMGPLERAWMGLALAISRVTTPALMAVLFFLVFLPMELALRALGRNPIARRSGGSTSFWVQRPARAEAPGERWRQF